MCRIGDIGAYEKGNIYIAKNSRNHEDAWKSGKPRKPQAKGHGKGVYKIDGRNRSKPYVAKACGKYIGIFATEQEAREAYLKATR